MGSLYAGDLAGATREAEEAVKADPRLVTAYVPLAAAAALTAPDTARIHYERLATVTPGGPSLAASGLADLALYQLRYDAAANVPEKTYAPTFVRLTGTPWARAASSSLPSA